MSHQPERKEKDCLNCGAIVHGRYCHQCSQENTISHQSFWSLATHFVYDIFHFDGKFFDTLRFLLFRPGFVAREYIQGRRVRFLDPIRMYLFTSAVFFVILFSIKPSIDFNSSNYLLLDRAERMELVMALSARAKQQPNNTVLQKQLALLLDSTKQIELKINGNMTASGLVTYKGREYFLNAKADTVAARGGWLQKKIGSGTERFKRKYKDDYDAGANKLFDAFLHRLPYLLFFSLPFFAATLHFLYRKKSHLFFSDHAIFSIYHYIFSFILLLAIIAFNSLFNWSKWSLFSWIVAFLVAAWPVHLFISLKRFYEGSYGRTLANFLLLNFLGSIILAFLLVIFFMFSFFM